MTPAVFLAILWLVMASSSPSPDPILDAEWQKWKIKYGKTYSLTLEEFRKEMIEIPVPTVKKGKSVQKRLSVNLPKFINWKKRGYVTPVRTQIACNSCWAISVTGAIEGQMFRKTGQLIPLSVQNLVDCVDGSGCHAGSVLDSFKYLMEKGGLESEATYPYEDKQGSCRYNPENSTASITGFEFIPNNEVDLMSAVASLGPISVVIDAWHESFLFYKRGIYYEPNCNNSLFALRHAVLLVGYGFIGRESEGRKYWIIKNSLGTKWGYKGYMKIAKDQGNHCGIASLPVFPRV